MVTISTESTFWLVQILMLALIDNKKTPPSKKKTCGKLHESHIVQKQ